MELQASTLNYILCKSNKIVHWNLQNLCTFWLMGVHIYCKLYHIQTFKAVSEIPKFLAKISLDSHFVCVQWQKRERVKRSKVRAWSKLHWKCRRKSMATGLDITELAKKRNAQHTTSLDVQTASKITKAYNKFSLFFFRFQFVFPRFFLSRFDHSISTRLNFMRKFPVMATENLLCAK